jgi:hypothetical protein
LLVHLSAVGLIGLVQGGRDVAESGDELADLGLG